MVIGVSASPVLDDSIVASDGFGCLAAFFGAFLGATTDIAPSLVVEPVAVGVAVMGFLGG